jgi:hypothetical protein
MDTHFEKSSSPWLPPNHRTKTHNENAVVDGFYWNCRGAFRSWLRIIVFFNEVTWLIYTNLEYHVDEKKCSVYIANH